MIESDKKKRKVSKKTKRSWRKHVDTKDVDSFLECTRLEERLGVPFAERSDKDLFVVDSNPDTATTDEYKTKQERRAALKNSVPRCWASLNSYTAVPDPIAKRNRVKTPEERKNPITKRLQSERIHAGKLNLTERLAAKNKKLAAEKRSSRHKRGEFNSDAWQETPVLVELDKDWLTSDTVRHNLAVQGIRKRKIVTSLRKKPSALPAVNVPHPGTSYNPSYEDHQSLLREVADEELKLMKQEAHLNRVTTKMFRKVSAEQRDKDALRENSEGLSLKPEKEQLEKALENGEVEDNVVKSVNPPVKNTKKTLVQRRKQKEQRILKLKVKHAKVEKKKVSDIYKLKALKNHLKMKEEKVEKLREVRQKVKERKALEPNTLSKNKFEPLEQVFQLGEELPGNLRNADQAGSLLKDRFKSLQQRSLVAPTTRVL